MENQACVSPQQYVENHQNIDCQINNTSAGENTIPVQTNTWNYRPHGALARALYEKQLSDERIDSLDKNQWYECDLTVIPEDVSRKFIKLSFDDETDLFLKQSAEKSDWIFMQLWHSLAKSVLSWFMTQTNINGLLGRGSMFVLSFKQFLQLLKAGPEYGTWRRSTLLDLGAGDGEVTAKLAPAFDTVYVTEMSHTMRGILQRRGYQLLDVNNWAYNETYDVISCLNLLDRCDSPLSLLQQIKTSLKPDGILIVALVLPFSQYVESGRADHKPTEALPITGSTFEQQVASVTRNVFTPAGFEVFSWTRVPYLCEGDLKQCYYWLDDSVFILKPVHNSVKSD